MVPEYTRKEPKMDFAKSLTKPNSGRRSFLWKAGVAVSAAVATAIPGMAKSVDGKNGEAERLAKQLGILEDEKAIRTLHKTYENLLDNGMYEEVVALFTEDAAVVFNGGVFKGKSSASRLYSGCFSAGMIGKKIGPVPGFDAAQETINVAADRLSAKAQFPYSIQVGAPIASDSSLVQMARLHGGGIMKWCESGTYEISYVKDSKDGGWKIKRLEYQVLSQTDYRPGKAYATPVSVSLFAQTYPENPAGPDKLIVPAQRFQGA
jgi:hypothetical protein